MDKQVNGAVVDLSDIMPADTSVVEILKPGGIGGTGWLITFAGPSHEKTIAWQDQSSKRALRKQQQIEQAQANGKKFKAEDRDPTDVRQENVEWVVSRIVDWTPVLIRSVSAEPIAFSNKAAMDLLVRPEMGWAFAQMVDILQDERAFMTRSAKS